MTMTRKTVVLTGALTAALTLPAAVAGAHVTVQPKTATPGSYTVEHVRVPNETDDANTTKVAVQFPPGFASVSTQRVPGWRVKVTKERLTTPIKTDDGEITEGVTQITWTADDKAAAIAPGGFQDFPISVLVPGKVGEKLTFKALQTYDDGEVVRWIGGPDSEEPAPQVTLVAAAIPAGVADTASAAGGEDGGGGGGGGNGNGLAIVALMAGGLGVLLGGAGLASARRKPA